MDLDSYRRLLELVAQPRVLERVLTLLPILCGLVGLRGDQSIDWRTNRFLGIINSMTQQERDDRSLLADPSRQRRIAAGAGISPSEVKSFLTEFDEAARMVEAMQELPLYSRLRYAQAEIDDVRRHPPSPAGRTRHKLGTGSMIAQSDARSGTAVNRTSEGAWEVRLDSGELVVATSHTGRRADMDLIEPGTIVYVVADVSSPFRCWIVGVERDLA